MVIHDIDESIRELLDAEIVRGANIEIAFDAPDAEWAARRQGPAINCFLYEVREDTERRGVQFEPRRDSDGFVTSRTTPPRRFKLSYLITVWAQRPEDEHRLLASVLELLVDSDEFPQVHLQGRAADAGPIRTTIALPLPPERSLSDVWSSLGGNLRPALDLVVTVPMGGVRSDPLVGPPVLEGPRVSILGPDGERLPPMRTPAERRAAVASADGGGESDDRAPAAATDDATVRPPAPVRAAARETVDAARFQRGRRIAELGEDDVDPGRRLGVTSLPRRSP